MALLARYDTPYGTIKVTRSPVSRTISYLQNGCYHSQARRDGTSVCVYIHAMHEIVRQSRTRNVLIIGGAGGTLATMLRRLHRRVTIVDINPAAFTIARRHFRLPPDVRCVRRDGIAFLRLTPMRFDVVIVDVFGSHNHVPKNFTITPFFDLVRQRLAPSGMMIMNTITADDDDCTADRIARHAHAAGMDMTLIDWPGQKNRNSLLVSNLLRHARLPSGHEPRWITDDYKGMIRRKARCFG